MKGDIEDRRQEQKKPVVTVAEGEVETLGIDIKKKEMPLNFITPPTVFTHVSFGIWCVLALVVAVLWVMNLVTL